MRLTTDLFPRGTTGSRLRRSLPWLGSDRVRRPRACGRRRRTRRQSLRDARPTRTTSSPTRRSPARSTSSSTTRRARASRSSSASATGEAPGASGPRRRRARDVERRRDLVLRPPLAPLRWRPRPCPTARSPPAPTASAPYPARRRFDLGAPRRVGRGSRRSVRVVDRWGIGGIGPRAVHRPPGERPPCRTVAVPACRDVREPPLSGATEPRRWRVELRVSRAAGSAPRSPSAKALRARRAPPIALATGDSTIQGIDSFLSDELADARPSGATRTPAAVSPAVFSGRGTRCRTSSARARASRVISVGAATDGLPLATAIGTLHRCCGEPWIAGLRQPRARDHADLPARRPRTRLLAHASPAALGAAGGRSHMRLDVAVHRAAAGLAGVRVIRIDRFFSPARLHGRITLRGREVPVRESDGVHLNVSGLAITAKAVAEVIRLRPLPPPPPPVGPQAANATRSRPSCLAS